jgi:hypothetical protein
MIGLAEVLVVGVIVLLIFLFRRKGGLPPGHTTLPPSIRDTLSGKTVLVVIIAGVVTGVIARVTGDWMGVTSGGVVESAVGGGVAGAVGGFIVYRTSIRG